MLLRPFRLMYGAFIIYAYMCLRCEIFFCVHISIRIHNDMHACVHKHYTQNTHTNTYTHTHTRTHTHARIHTNTHTHIHVHTHTHTHAGVAYHQQAPRFRRHHRAVCGLASAYVAHTNTHACMHSKIHMQTYLNACMHTNIHEPKNVL
jgi:hypothetical protein